MPNYLAYQFYEVYFNSDTIKTIVTKNPFIIDFWISDMLRIHRSRINRLIIGLKTSPNLTDYCPGTLQLCIGRSCIIIQLKFLPYWPESLKRFLSDYIFIGVDVAGDAKKLQKYFGVLVGVTIDLTVVAEQLNRSSLRRASLREFVGEVLGVPLLLPIIVTATSWEIDKLSDHQVEYACLGAYASFEVWRVMTNN